MPCVFLGVALHLAHHSQVGDMTKSKIRKPAKTQRPSIPKERLVLVRRAIDRAGTPKQLAQTLGVKAPTVYQWSKGERPVPPKFCFKIEEFMCGEISAHELLPDVIPAKNDPQKPKTAA
jgi:DNA-binding transcriptional regulator YdaS (Cro superfamily)